MFLAVRPRPAMKTVALDHSLETFPLGNSGDPYRLSGLKHGNVHALSGVFQLPGLHPEFPDKSERPQALKMPQLRLGGALGDRKSTRLNSSHMSTSYAVF